MIGWRRARRRRSGRPGGEAEHAPEDDAPPAEDASEIAAVKDAVPPAEDAEPTVEHVAPSGAAALAEALLATSVDGIDELDEPPVSVAGPSPATFTEEATASEVGPDAEPGTEAPDPVLSAVPPDAIDAGSPSGDLGVTTRDHVHWAVVATVMVATGAAVTTLLLLAGHVL